MMTDPFIRLKLQPHLSGWIKPLQQTKSASEQGGLGLGPGPGVGHQTDSQRNVWKTTFCLPPTIKIAALQATATFQQPLMRNCLTF